MPDGLEKPVGFFWEPWQRKLFPNGKRMPSVQPQQLWCETLPFAYWVINSAPGTRLKFILQTDHEPLQTLFSSGETVPAHASSWIQSRMKSLAWSLMWWLGMDHKIEDMVKYCAECQRTQSTTPSVPLHPWKWPTRSWVCLHVDFVGLMDGRMYLIVEEEKPGCQSTLSRCWVQSHLK